jgi:hypothetical protein
MMRWAETGSRSATRRAVCDSEARPKVACRRTTAGLSATSRHARHADSEGSIPYTPAKKEGGSGPGALLARRHGRLTTRRRAQTMTLLSRRVAHLADSRA